MPPNDRVLYGLGTIMKVKKEDDSLTLNLSSLFPIEGLLGSFG
jgi:hypothetical protein